MRKQLMQMVKKVMEQEVLGHEAWKLPSKAGTDSVMNRKWKKKSKRRKVSMQAPFGEPLMELLSACQEAQDSKNKQ